MPRYAEHENLNSLRNYPFAESVVVKDDNGAPLSSDVFVDAILHPIVSVPSLVNLASVDFVHGGEVTLLCGDIVLKGHAEKNASTMDLYDGHGRRSGTLGLGDGWQREYETFTVRRFSNAVFCSAVTCPIVYDGVEGFDLPSGEETTRKNVVFVGDDCLTPVIERSNAGTTLSFDAIFDPGKKENEGAVRQIVFAAIGKTVFSISRYNGSSVLVTTPMLDREDICWQAHREDSVSTIVDTCEETPKCPEKPIPTQNQEIVVCPSEIGSISIVADDVIGLKNPIKIGALQGVQVVPTSDNKSGRTIEETMDIGSEAVERPTIVGSGIKIYIPGIGDE